MLNRILVQIFTDFKNCKSRKFEQHVHLALVSWELLSKRLRSNEVKKVCKKTISK
jgi:hypothetical protein